MALTIKYLPDKPSELMKSKPKKITIYQVANRAGVAISTVSRVLNNSPNVSKKTKEKVNEAIEELNFRPQVSARKLASQEPQMLAIAVPSFTTPYYNEVLKGVKDEIKEMDLDIVIYNTGSKNPKEGITNFLIAEPRIRSLPSVLISMRMFTSKYSPQVFPLYLLAVLTPTMTILN